MDYSYLPEPSASNPLRRNQMILLLIFELVQSRVATAMAQIRILANGPRAAQATKTIAMISGSIERRVFRIDLEIRYLIEPMEILSNVVD
jgi:hypothetical protein